MVGPVEHTAINCTPLSFQFFQRWHSSMMQIFCLTGLKTGAVSIASTEFNRKIEGYQELV